MIIVSPYAEFTVYHPRPGLRTAAEIKRQKTRRQEGPAFDSIFLLLLLLGPPTESAPQEGASSSAPRSPRARRSERRGSGFSQTHRPPGLWRAGPSDLRREQLSTTQCPNSSSLRFSPCPRPLGCSSRHRRPSLPRRHLSISERCPWVF